MEKNIWKRMILFILLALVLSLSYQFFVAGSKFIQKAGSSHVMAAGAGADSDGTAGKAESDSDDTAGKAVSDSARISGGAAADMDSDGVPADGGAANPKYIAITFDDGPKQGTTDVLLDGLRERGVKATFFIIGQQVEGNEEIIRQMAQDGHLIGNHTFNHVNLAKLSTTAGAKELAECFGEFAPLTGQEECLVRPPYGEVSDTLKKNIDCPIVLWSVDTRDWTGKSAQDIADYIVATAKTGDVILLHDIYKDSVQGALMAIDTMQKNGYTFVTVTELFEKNGISMESGKVYRKTY